VGGGVRDLLLGREPKDFDVATDARPEDVRRVFRNCRLIGRRFRLAHVHFGPEIIEVATFRGVNNAEESDDHELDNGMKLMDENSPRKKNAPAAEEGEPEVAVAKREGPSAQQALAKWWKHARTPSSGPRDPATATEIVTCRIGGATSFMSKTDCEIQGGTF